MERTAVFDVNETTLDLEPIRVAVNEIFERQGAFDTWFARLLQTSMAASATGQYVDFSTLARSALGSVAQTEGQPLPSNAFDMLGAAMGSLRAHPDVVAPRLGPGRSKGRGHGHRFRGASRYALCRCLPTR